mgnify:FL=1
MKSAMVLLVFWFLTVPIEAYRLPGLNHFRKSDQKPSIDFGKFVSSLRNLIVGKSWEVIEDEDVESDEPNLEDKMIPNPQVGFPYYLSFMKFNQEVEEQKMTDDLNVF